MSRDDDGRFEGGVFCYERDLGQWVVHIVDGRPGHDEDTSAWLEITPRDANGGVPRWEDPEDYADQMRIDAAIARAEKYAATEGFDNGGEDQGAPL